MNIEEFNEIIKIPSTSLMSKYNIEIERSRFSNKEYYDWVIQDLNYNGNAVFTNEEGDANLQKMYTSEVFTEKNGILYCLIYSIETLIRILIS